MRQRSKTGCLTCKKRKIKCDETRLKCRQCIKHQFSCEWPTGKTIQPTLQSRSCSAKRTQLSIHSKISIRPALTDQHVTCANSLILSQKDRLLLEYFSSSTVYAFYDFFEWGVLQYIVQRLAPRSRLVTRMILALSGSEMYSQSSRREDTARRSVDEGLNQYTICLQELVSELSEPEREERLEGKLATLIFMIHYELHFTGSLDRVQTHLQGFWALISNDPLFNNKNLDLIQSYNDFMPNSDSRLVICCQLTGWALYHDVATTSFRTSCSLMKLLSGSERPGLRPMQLCQLARAGGHRIWGKPLPVSALFNDMTLCRPIELGWQVMSARFAIWDLRSTQLDDPTTTSRSLAIWDHLMDLGNRYCDVLHMANELLNEPWTPTVEVITRIVTFYWATLLFHRRIFSSSCLRHKCHETALLNVTNLLFYRYKRVKDPRKQSRVVWCTFMAAVETCDMKHRDRLIEILRFTREVSVECRKLNLIANNILSIQGTSQNYWSDEPLV